MYSMVHRGRRSPEAINRYKQKQIAFSFVKDSAFKDDWKYELVELKTREEIARYILNIFGKVDYDALPMFERAEVLEDHYGDGTLQTEIYR